MSEQEHDIAILELSPRAYNCLKRTGIHTVEQLSRIDEEQLLKIRNFGFKSMDEVRAALILFDAQSAEHGEGMIEELIGSIKNKTTYTAYDALGRQISLGSFVTYTYSTKTGTHEHTGIVKEIAFKIDGSVWLRVDGRVNTPVNSNETKVTILNDQEALIVEEFAKRGVKLELSEAKNLAANLVAMISFHELAHEESESQQVDQ